MVGVVIATASVVLLPPLAVAKMRLARRLSSSALRGDAVLTAMGALLAAATLAGLLLTQLLSWRAGDPVAGLVIALVLIREGIALLRESSPARVSTV